MIASQSLNPEVQSGTTGVLILCFLRGLEVLIFFLCCSCSTIEKCVFYVDSTSFLHFEFPAETRAIGKLEKSGMVRKVEIGVTILRYFVNKQIKVAQKFC